MERCPGSHPSFEGWPVNDADLQLAVALVLVLFLGAAYYLAGPISDADADDTPEGEDELT